jgi:endonuclease/exonuclease/phosphatase (EEP) superfamily protein YafD
MTSQGSFVSVIDFFLMVVVAGLCLLTFAGFWGRRGWLLDITSHFRVQYFFLLVLSSLSFLALGLVWGAAAALGLALVNGAVILPRFVSLAHAASNGPSYRLLLTNVFRKNRSYDHLRGLVVREQPDLVVLIEPDQAWIDALAGLRQDYPYWQVASREDAYGIALFSRQPFESAEVAHLGSAEMPTVVVRLHLTNHHDWSLTVIATHPPPPKGAAHSARRNDQLKALAQFVRQQSEAVILCGDLNVSPWSPYFSDLLKYSGLADSGRGFGIQPTWPVDNYLLRTSIDHCLVSSQIAVRRRRLGPRIGSDHLPIILDFSLVGAPHQSGEFITSPDHRGDS